MEGESDPAKLSNVQSNVLLLLMKKRADAGISQEQVAEAAGLSHKGLVSRYEKGRWPDDPDRVIAAYAELCGFSVRALWRKAAEHSEAPLPGSPKALALETAAAEERAARRRDKEAGGR